MLEDIVRGLMLFSGVVWFPFCRSEQVSNLAMMFQEPRHPV
jgi:hypothetical protein